MKSEKTQSKHNPRAVVLMDGARLSLESLRPDGGGGFGQVGLSLV